MSKKVKLFSLIMIIFIFPIFIFACEDKNKVIKMQEITLNSYSITLRTDEEFVLTSTITPANTTNKTLKYSLTDDSVVSIEYLDNYNLKIIANKQILGPVSTYLQVLSEDESIKSATCKISVLTDKTELFTPQNLTFDSETQTIVWDKVDSSSGYKLLIGESEDNLQEYYSVTNFYKSEIIFNRPLIVKVKSVGDDVVYSDSEYSEPLKFIQLKEPTNLRNENTKIYFDKIENAYQYKIRIKQNGNLINECLILNSDYDENIGYNIVDLQDNGEFSLSVQAIPQNQDQDLLKFSSTFKNEISITRFDTPITSDENFHFNFSNNTFSWKSILGATGYQIIQIGSAGQTIINLTDTDNTYQIDTVQNRLESGDYQYALKIIGNNTSYLNSRPSNFINITKLASPTARAQGGDIQWSAISSSDGYIYVLDANTETSTHNTVLKLLDSDVAGLHHFKIKAVGNGINSISSDYSEDYSFTKLKQTEMPILQDNRYLIINASTLIDLMEVHITTNNVPQVEYVNEFETITLGEDEFKTFKIDLSASKYSAGDYIVYTRCYGENTLRSNKSENYSFKKLTNTNTISIEDGKLVWSLIENACSAKLYVGSNLIYTGDKTSFDELEPAEIGNFNFEAGVQYNVCLQYLPQANNNIVVSDISAVKTISKLNKPNSIYAENGEVIVPTSQGEIIYNISNGVETYKSNSLKLLENLVYNLSAFYYGGTQYISSDSSNEIKVKIMPVVSDLTLTGDSFSFTGVDSCSYAVVYKINEPNNQANISVSFNGTTFSLKDSFQPKYALYEELTNYVEASIVYNGTSVYPSSADIAILNRSYAQNYEEPNTVKFRVLSTPKDLFIAGLKEIEQNSKLNLNKLYFTSNSMNELFELKYTNTTTEEEKTILLTENNYLKNVGVNAENLIIYEVNTEFLSPASYNLSLKAVSQSVESVGDSIYVVSSFDEKTYSNAVKLSPVTSLSCENDKIIINDDDTQNLKVLLINGKLIYDDILEENQSLMDILKNVEPSSIGNILVSVNKFKTETNRELKDSYTGTFSVSAIKMYISTSPFDYLSGYPTTNIIASEQCPEIVVTRLTPVQPILKNGFVEWTCNDSNVESFEVTICDKTENDEYNKKTTITVNKQEGAYQVDLVSALDGVQGEYGVYIQAKTTKSNFLSSIKTETMPFKILQTPNMFIEDGCLNWNNVESAKGYLLNIYKDDSLLTTLNFDQTITKFDMANYVSGNYSFEIQALGELSKSEPKDESSIIKSILSAKFNTTKLEKPIEIAVQEGKIVVFGVPYGNKYQLVDEGKVVNEVLQFAEDQQIFVLGAKYKSGQYSLKYRALGGSDYINSEFSLIKECEKLSASKELYVVNGELEWETTQNFSYLLKIGEKELKVLNNQYTLSADTTIASNIYQVSVVALGDSTLYLSSDPTTLDNVIKLGEVKNVRIEDGILTWDAPEIVNATSLNTKGVPINLSIVFEKNNVFSTYSLKDGQNTIALDDEFSSGSYKVTFVNVGTKEKTKSGSLYINSATVIKDNITKLSAPEDLNINDGINLKWINNNLFVGRELSYLINIIQEDDDSTIEYSGIINLNLEQIGNVSVEFNKLMYYKKIDPITSASENVLVLLDDSSLITQIEGKYYYDGIELHSISKTGEFNVKVLGYGGNKYANSDYSNTITITVPDPVTNLEINYGKITWDSELTNGGYILTLTRYLDEAGNNPDEEYNRQNQFVYISQKHFNLTDVNYFYTVVVRAYSIKTEGSIQMASAPEMIYNYYFNSFTDGNGEDNPYVIDTEERFKLISYNNKANYVLTNNISLNNFAPLFTKNNPFIGTITGYSSEIQYHITNLTINNYYVYSGIFGYISNETITYYRVIDGVESEYTNNYVGTVKDFVIDNIEITQGIIVGAIAGYSAGLIENVSLNGSVSTSSETSIDVNASNEAIYTGSVVGQNAGRIINVINTAIVNPTSQYSAIYVGGICGINEESAEILYCTNNAKVKGTVAGGICGMNKGLVLGCIATGDIRVSNGSNNTSNLLSRAGGICAINSSSARVANCVVNNAMFKTGSNDDFDSWHGIIDLSTTNINDSTIILGGLIGENNGETECNIVKIEIRVKNSSIINYKVGKLFGYCTNNSQSNNFVLTEDYGLATYLCGEGSVSINSNNRAYDSLTDQRIINILNANTDNVLWRLEEDFYYPYI